MKINRFNLDMYICKGDNNVTKLQIEKDNAELPVNWDFAKNIFFKFSQSKQKNKIIILKNKKTYKSLNTYFPLNKSTTADTIG